MPRYLKIHEIRAMTYLELKRWWEVDFDVLVSTAVAEADGRVDSTVSEALNSDDWIEQWADALYAGAGELASSIERMAFTGDPRLTKVKRRGGVVLQRMGQVNGLLKARRADQGWEMLGEHLKDARLAALAILAKHYREEYLELRAQELARRGLPSDHPFYHVSYRDVFDAIEDAVTKGLIDAPSDSGRIQALLSAPPDELTSLAAGDTTHQQDRCDELRHPLLLRRWAGALEHLRDRHCELAGLEPVFTTELTSLDMKAVRSLKEEDAWALINRRRFIRALGQRWRECQMHVRQLGRVAAQRKEDVAKPWHEAEHAARQELGRRYPQQLDLLIAGFTPFCEPGTTRIKRGALSTHQRGLLVNELKKSLP